MATRKKSATTKQRASVGRELKLALALVAVLDAIDDAVDNPDTQGDEVTTAKEAAHLELTTLGYGNLDSIPRRLRRLNELLKQAIADSNGAEIARLGNELVRAQQGKPPLKSPAAPAPKKSSRSSGAAKSTASIATETEGAGDVGGE